MDVLPIDLTALLAIFMGTMMIIIPIAGLTARFALKPLVESFGKYLQGAEAGESLRVAESRIALLEQSVDALQDELARVRDAQDFDTALRGGTDRAALPAAAPQDTGDQAG